MRGFDLDHLLKPVSSTDPSGEDLAYSPDFQQLVDAARGRPERVMGKTVSPAVQPDWKLVVATGVELLSRSKDIRIATLLCVGLFHTEGFPGLASGIALIKGLLAEYWDSLYPQFDPEDNKDPTERLNALLSLCDLEGLLIPVRTAPLVRSRTFGEVSLRDVEIAKGESSVPGDQDGVPLDMATINAAFLDSERERLRETASAVSRAVGDIAEIETLVAGRVGESQAPDLDPIRNLLAAADTLLNAKIAERADESAKESMESVDEGAEPQGQRSAHAQVVPVAQPGSAITSREDVVRILDRICDYYAHSEPSSPVPLLLRRARRLVTKDFMGIVQDLAPAAVAQIEAIRGSEEDG